MLVLTRRVNEKIRIDGASTVTIVRIANGSVRVGIEASDAVRIVRDELPTYPVEVVAVPREEGEP